MTPDLTERRARLYAFVREHKQPGSCRIISQGPYCQCILCDFEAITNALDDLEAERNAPSVTVEDAIQASRSAADAWQKTADAYQKAIDTITRIQEAKK